VLVTCLVVTACTRGPATDRAQPDPATPDVAPDVTTASTPATGPTAPRAGASTPTAASRAPPAGSTPTEEAPAESAEPGEVQLELITDALEQPVMVATRPGDDRLYVAERTGRVRVVDGGEVAPEPYLDLSSLVSTNSERGLLGVTFDPAGEHFYAHYTDPDGTSTLAAWPVADTLAAADRDVLFTAAQPYANHNGGHIEFGPDGYLYLALGDGGAAGDPLENGQDPSTVLGAILRLEPTPEGPDGYRIPPDNPFVDDQDGAPEVWAYGLRNPWRFAFDRQGGKLWIGDVGQGAVEEIDAVETGRGGLNFGWDALEGDELFEGPPPPDAVAPVYTYPHSEGISVTGGRVSRGERAASLRGWYVFGDFGTGFVRALRASDPGDVVDLGIELPGLVSFAVDTDGNLLAMSIDGGLYRVVDA
jgi:glucose/arabinose dehydrogenase